MLCPFSFNSSHSPKNVVGLVPFFSDQETTVQKITELEAELEFEHSTPDFCVLAVDDACAQLCPIL